MSEAQRHSEQTRGWCSLRLRFDERELVLLRGAEQLRGVELARNPRPTVLRSALTLARAGRKLGVAVAGASVSLDEPELTLLVEALRFAHTEVQWAAREQDGAGGSRREAISAAFPELAERGGWRSFGLTRELEALTSHLQGALSA